jgi:hypothetical protein
MTVAGFFHLSLRDHPGQRKSLLPPFELAQSSFEFLLGDKFDGVRQNKQIISGRAGARTELLKRGLIVELNFAGNPSQSKCPNRLRTDIVLQNRAGSELKLPLTPWESIKLNSTESGVRFAIHGVANASIPNEAPWKDSRNRINRPSIRAITKFSRT